MDKIDYKKNFKDLYLPKQNPVIVTVPTIDFIMIEGNGDPNGEAFAQATAALYALSYAVRMSYKGKDVPKNYYHYTVFPLEGIWDLVDKTLPPTVKSNLKYQLMIRQPDFLTADLFDRFLSETKKKKPNPFLDKARFFSISEGLCCQMLHKGSYDDEPASFEIFTVTVTFPENEWVYGYILSYGCHAEVLAPIHIREIIKRKFEEGLKKYL